MKDCRTVAFVVNLTLSSASITLDYFDLSWLYSILFLNQPFNISNALQVGVLFIYFQESMASLNENRFCCKVVNPSWFFSVLSFTDID